LAYNWDCRPGKREIISRAAASVKSKTNRESSYLVWLSSTVTPSLPLLTAKLAENIGEERK
jgi:hypothetical protein